MSEIDTRLAALGLTLPPPFMIPAGLSLPFEFVQVCGTRVLISATDLRAPMA